MMGKRRKGKGRGKQKNVREESSKIKAEMRLGRHKNPVIKFTR